MMWPLHRIMVDSETEQYLKMLLGSVDIRTADRLRQCGEPAIRARHRPPARSSGADSAGSRARARHRATGHGKRPALAGRSGLRPAGGQRSASRLMRNNMPPEIQRYILGWQNMQLDVRALLFTLAAAVAAGIIAGLAPAWQCSRPNLTDTLKEGGRGVVGGRRPASICAASWWPRRSRLAVVLLVGAGLMVRGFQSMLVAGERLEPATASYPAAGTDRSELQGAAPDLRVLSDRAGRVSALPGVRSAAVVTAMPYADHSSGRGFTIEGRPVEQGDLPSAMYQVASPSYFRTVHVPLRAGRLIGGKRRRRRSQGGGDQRGDGASAGGRTSRLSASTFASAAVNSKNPWLTIVGVVGDMVHDPYDREPRRTIYLPFQQAPSLMDGCRSPHRGRPHAAGSGGHGRHPVGGPRSSPSPDMMTVAEGHSQPRHRSELHGLDDGHLRRDRAGALGHRGVWRDGVPGLGADPRDRHPHGTGRARARSVLAMVFRRGMVTIAAGLAMGLPWPTASRA